MIPISGRNLVFLLSLPRSGSTLLSVLLGKHSQVLAPPEPWFLLQLLQLGEPTRAFRDFGAEHAALATRAFLGESLDKLTREFAVAAYADKLRRSKKSVFIDKTPRYYHIYARLKSLFPDARFIWLKRNPLDIAASFKDSWKVDISTLHTLPFSQYTYDFTIGLDTLSQTVRTPTSKDCVVSYENLVINPHETLRNLCAFLEINFETRLGELDESSLKNYAGAQTYSGDEKIFQSQGIRSGSIGRWRSVLDEQDLGALAHLISPQIAEVLGYPDVIDPLAHYHVERIFSTDRSQHPPSSDNPEDLYSNIIRRLRNKDDTIAEQKRQLEELTQACRSLNAQLASLNESVRSELDEKQGTLLQAIKQVTELTHLIKDRESKLSEFDTQLGELNAVLQERETALVALNDQLREVNLIARSQADEANVALQERETALVALNDQLREVNLIARSQADEANERMLSLERQISAREKTIAQKEQVISQLKQAIHDNNKQITVVSGRLHRAHWEASLANRLLAMPPVAMSPTANWSAIPLPLGALIPAAEKIHHHVEVNDRSHDVIRFSGWAFTLSKDYVFIPPVLLIDGPYCAWSLPGWSVDRSDVVEAFSSKEEKDTPILQCGFVFEFLTTRVPESKSREVRVCFGLVHGAPCLTPPITLP